LTGPSIRGAPLEKKDTTTRFVPWTNSSTGYFCGEKGLKFTLALLLCLVMNAYVTKRERNGKKTILVTDLYIFLDTN
jgi:hypothetical protein